MAELIDGVLLKVCMDRFVAIQK